MLLLHLYNQDFLIFPDFYVPTFSLFHLSLFDQSIEGIKSKKYKAFSVQYHPEASPGPQELQSLFDTFIAQVNKYAKKN